MLIFFKNMIYMHGYDHSQFGMVNIYKIRATF